MLLHFLHSLYYTGIPPTNKLTWLMLCFYGELTKHSESKVGSPLVLFSRACWEVETLMSSYLIQNEDHIKDISPGCSHTGIHTGSCLQGHTHTHTHMSELTCFYHRNKSKWCGWISLSSVACGIFMCLKQHLHYFLCY